MTEQVPVFRVLIRTRVKEGAAAAFEQAWAEVGKAISNEPANLAQWLMKSAEEPDVYYILSDWVDEDHFRHFERSPGHVTNRARLRPYRAEDVMATMHVVIALEKTKADQRWQS